MPQQLFGQRATVAGKHRPCGRLQQEPFFLSEQFDPHDKNRPLVFMRMRGRKRLVLPHHAFQ